MRKTPISVVVATLCWSASSEASGTLSYECVTKYSACNVGGRYYPDLTNCCTESQNFSDKMTSLNGATLNSTHYEESAVYDSDLIESDWYPNAPRQGHDNVYTDTASVPTNIEFLSGHGACNYPIDTTRYCNSDSDCVNGYKCFTGNNAHRCVGYGDRYWATCSSGDTFGDAVDISTQVCLGENATHPFTWKGCGTNGSMSYLAMDTSCGLEPLYEIQGNGNMFGGVLVTMGFEGYLNSYPSTTLGDVGDSATRGANFATRLTYESVANAWVDATAYDEPGGGMTGPACVVSMACDDSQSDAVWDINYAGWIEGWNLVAKGYSWCQIVTWCDF